MQSWEVDELEEQISQAVLLLSKLLITPDDCALRTVCENYIEAHKQYVPEQAGYDISKLDGNPESLNY